MGGNLINYPKNIGTNTAMLLFIKIFLNSVISTHGTQFMSIGLANFYLMTPLNDLNLPRSSSATSRTRSYKNTASTTKPHPMVGYTFDAAVGCMAFPRLAASDKTS